MGEGGTCNPQTKKAAQEQLCAAQTADHELRRQCLTWAFQTREFCDVPHLHVVNAAQGYYDFVTGRHQVWLDAMQAFKGGKFAGVEDLSIGSKGK